MVRRLYASAAERLWRELHKPLVKLIDGCRDVGFPKVRLVGVCPLQSKAPEKFASKRLPSLEQRKWRINDDDGRLLEQVDEILEDVAHARLAAVARNRLVLEVPGRIFAHPSRKV